MINYLVSLCTNIASLCTVGNITPGLRFCLAAAPLRLYSLTFPFLPKYLTRKGLTLRLCYIGGPQT